MAGFTVPNNLLEFGAPQGEDRLLSYPPRRNVSDETTLRSFFWQSDELCRMRAPDPA